MPRKELKEYKGMSKSQLWKTLAIIALAGVFWAYFTGPEKARTAPKKAPEQITDRNYPVMDTFVQVSFYGNPQLAEKAADKVRDIFSEVERACNIFNPESEIFRLNATAYQKPFKCSPLLWEALLLSRNAYKISNGAFDITARPLMRLWGFYRKQGKFLPDSEAVKEAMQKIGLNKVIFDDSKRSVKFTVPDMSFDLGGIAKGLAVEMAAEEALRLGVQQGVINLGGNMYCLPKPPPGKKLYHIGIRNPIKKRFICGTVGLKKQAIATSGNYERYVTIDGKQYTHIMNPKTGRPVAGMLSVTVICPDATAADYLSTSVFINGPKFAAKIVKEQPDTQILIIRRKPGAPGKIEVIKFGEIWGKIRI